MDEQHETCAACGHRLAAHREERQCLAAGCACPQFRRAREVVDDVPRPPRRSAVDPWALVAEAATLLDEVVSEAGPAEDWPERLAAWADKLVDDRETPPVR